MIKIRLKREGVKNKPFYRVVAINSTTKNGGRALEVLGYYNPLKEVLKVDRKKVANWLSLGAQESPTVKKLLESK